MNGSHAGTHRQEGWRRGAVWRMHRAGTASCFLRSRANAWRHCWSIDYCRLLIYQDPGEPDRSRAKSFETAASGRRPCLPARRAPWRSLWRGAVHLSLNLDGKGSGPRATWCRSGRIWRPGAGPRAMERCFSAFRQAAGSADWDNLLSRRGGASVGRKAGEGIREAERAGRPVQEAGRADPGIQQRAADRNAQDDQAPQHLVPTADTWAMDEIAHRVEHQRVLCRSKANDHRGEQERLQGHGARSSGQRSDRNHIRLRRDASASDRHDQITCSGERVICAFQIQYRREVRTPRLYVRNWSITPLAR